MPSSITRAYPVAILKKDLPVGCHEHRSEWIVPSLQSLCGQFDTAVQVLHFRILHHDWLLPFRVG
jgi:hypothetical protein